MRPTTAAEYRLRWPPPFIRQLLSSCIVVWAFGEAGEFEVGNDFGVNGVASARSVEADLDPSSSSSISMTVDIGAGTLNRLTVRGEIKADSTLECCEADRARGLIHC